MSVRFDNRNEQWTAKQTTFKSQRGKVVMQKESKTWTDGVATSGSPQEGGAAGSTRAQLKNK